MVIIGLYIERNLKKIIFSRNATVASDLLCLPYKRLMKRVFSELQMKEVVSGQLTKGVVSERLMERIISEALMKGVFKEHSLNS